ncbi:MAG: sugar ABC transporter ATP-binding protein [Syntrophales bacterium]|nr:sugar ABC transporter ATP-binding protein [Syntrophales bacterium]
MPAILSVSNIVKRYPGVTALDRISLDFFAGEVHAICGENGAGKSTLIKILTGAIMADEGTILIDGIPRRGFSPHEAMFRFGISAIYQEFNLVPFLSIAENIFLGNERKRNGFLDVRGMNDKASELLLSLGIDLNPRKTVNSLTVAYQQIVEIAKAVSHNAKILIMDEPSAPLTTNEVEKMFDMVRILKARGVSVIYISHRLSEIFELSDRVSVFRDGRHIKTMRTETTDKKELISLMVGRELTESYPSKPMTRREVLMEVRDLSTPTLLRDVSFTLREGEILGFGGLVGSGRTKLARAIFGSDPISAGSIRLHGREVRIDHPRQAVRHGIGLIPEDRKQHGIISGLSVMENVAYSSFHKVSRAGIILRRLLRACGEKYRVLLRIVTPDLDKKVKELSGGNQQKVVLARWLATDCNLFIFDEPTRGIDVGAKQEIYELIAGLAGQGKGVILITSVMPELLGLSDRIIVMYEGRITGELSKAEATQKKVLQLASGEQES